MSESLRTYLRALRIKRGFSQEKAAEAIGWSSRSFNEWETGKTEDIKSRYLIRLVSFLEAPWEDVVSFELNQSALEDADFPQERFDKISLPDDDELKSLIEQICVDEKLRSAFLIFWAGWRARSSVK